jgi:hypothetical protein
VFIDSETGMHVVREWHLASSGERCIREEITDPATGKRWVRACVESVHTSVAEFFRRMRVDDEGRLAWELETASKLALMTDPQRIQWWRGSLDFQMRCECEAGNDRYAIYSLEFYEWARRLDPNIESVLQRVCAGLGLDARTSELCRWKARTPEWLAVRARISEPP